MKHSLKVPGKLIISGEQSVIYNKSAITTPIQKYINITMEEMPDNSVGNKHIQIVLKDFNIWKKVDFEISEKIKRDIRNKYKLFLNKQIAIREVLYNPSSLIVYTILHFLEMTEKDFHTTVRFTIDSQIPIGCGLGSSASVIVGIVRLLNDYFKTNLSKQRLYQLALQCENLQHGKSSGIDVYTVLNQNPCCFDNNNFSDLDNIEFDYAMLNTGKPESTTGECVNFVTKHKHKLHLWDKFKNITQKIKDSITQKDKESFKKLIGQNNELLYDIGVVSDKTMQFLNDLKTNYNGAGKICGAGTVKGDNNGILMVMVDDDISSLMEKYGYEMA